MVKIFEKKEEKQAEQPKNTIGGYNDLVSRARRVGLKDDASEKDVIAQEELRITKAPK